MQNSINQNNKRRKYLCGHHLMLSCSCFMQIFSVHHPSPLSCPLSCPYFVPNVLKILHDVVLKVILFQDALARYVVHDVDFEASLPILGWEQNPPKILGLKKLWVSKNIWSDKILVPKFRVPTKFLYKNI